MAVLSFDADAAVLPSGEKTISKMKSEWPSCACGSALDLISQSLTVLSCDADASVLPSGEKSYGVNVACIVLKFLLHSSQLGVL